MKPPVDVAGETRVPVARDSDIVKARMHGRAMAMQLGFPVTSATLIATAISELARNIVLYAGAGEISLSPIENGTRRGLMVVASDSGPGIADPAQSMRDGFSTSGRLGLGLPGVRRLMDEFDLRSQAGEGTCVTVKKWNG